MHTSFWNPSSLRHRLHALVSGLRRAPSAPVGHTMLPPAGNGIAMISVASSSIFTGAKARIGVDSRPVRIVRVLDAGQPRSGTGRMVISGRIADVCAELDRLAACEAVAH